MFRLIFIFSIIILKSVFAISIEQLCNCQSDKIPHFKERKDETNPCNVVELHLNDTTLIKDFNTQISQQLLQNAPIIKFPGRKMVKHELMTMALFKPIHIASLKRPESQQNVYIHWLISQIPSATSRFGDKYTFNLSPGYEYIEYLAPKHSQNQMEENKYILAFYHQHKTKDYFSSHRYRKIDHFLDSVGDMIICNIINIAP